MKKLIFISLLFSILSLSVSAQKPTKAEKAAQLEQEFQQTRQLIESNHFQFELNRVYPQGGQAVVLQTLLSMPFQSQR